MSRISQGEQLKNRINELPIRLQSEFTASSEDEETAYTAFNERFAKSPEAIARALASEAFFIIHNNTEALSGDAKRISDVLDVTNNGSRLGLYPAEPTWAKIADDPAHREAHLQYEKTRDSANARWRALTALKIMILEGLGENRAEYDELFKMTLDQKPQPTKQLETAA